MSKEEKVDFYLDNLRNEDFNNFLTTYGISDSETRIKLRILTDLTVVEDERYDREYSHQILPAIFLNRASESGVLDWAELSRRSREAAVKYGDLTLGRTYKLYKRGRTADLLKIERMDSVLKRRYISSCLSDFWKMETVDGLNRWIESEIKKIMGENQTC